MKVIRNSGRDFSSYRPAAAFLGAFGLGGSGRYEKAQREGATMENQLDGLHVAGVRKGVKQVLRFLCHQ